MPKLYGYFGFLILFYSNEHEPIHVHCKYQGKESKANIIYTDWKFVEVIISEVQGKEPLEIQNQKKFKKVVEAFREDIARKWIEFFVCNVPINCETITKKL